MEWALITHPDQFVMRRGHRQLLQAPMSVLEVSLPGALAQGWNVLIRDSEIVQQGDVQPHQSNPRRVRRGDSDYLGPEDDA